MGVFGVVRLPAWKIGELPVGYDRFDLLFYPWSFPAPPAQNTSWRAH